MAAYRTHIATFTTASGDKTATITPAIGDLFVVFCANSGQAGAPTVADNNAAGEYVEITSALKASSADRCSVFVRTQPLQNTTSTIVTMTRATTSGGGLWVVAVSGMSRAGANAVRQSQVQSNQAAAGTPAPVFGSAALTGNLTAGFVFNATNPATMTTPTGWTEQSDLGYITPTTGGELVTRDNGFTGTTVTWGSTSASAFADIIVELDNSVPPPAEGAEFVGGGYYPFSRVAERVAEWLRGPLGWQRRGRVWIPGWSV